MTGVRPQSLTDEQVRTFHRDGVVVVPGFYDIEHDIEPIRRDIHTIIGLVARRHGVAVETRAFDGEHFDADLPALMRASRAYASEVYDAVKQIPAFVRLCASERHDAIFRQLRADSVPAVAAGGYGIRMDHPGEDKYRANWHQEYPAQLRSMDGIVLWSPLVPITPEIGPIRFCLGSHRDGPVRVHTQDPRNAERSGAYALVLEDEEQLVGRYPQVAPLTSPGDLVVVDFLVVHASGLNRASRTRWSMQLRYFNFAHPSGLRIGWRGSFAAGEDFGAILPELVAGGTR